MKTKAKVLIIDDAVAIVNCVASFLRELGCEVVSAANGEAGLAIVQDDPELGVILLDIQMPGMTGKEVLAQLRVQCPDVPVIMITGEDDMDIAKECLALGAFDYITKPFDFEYLKTSVLTSVIFS